MEAAHLGAYFGPFRRTAMNEALAFLSQTAHFAPDATRWAQAAFAVRERFSVVDAGVSVGIPTWSIGSQPPAAFATHIGKYFADSIREDALLDRATAGVVFLPGSTGTVQEIFQNAAQNASVRHHSTPMIFLDEHFWTSELPVWPLLERLATRHSFSDLVWLVDTVEDAVRVLEDSRPHVGHPFAHAQAKVR
ncbi:MAG TPA: LOG family protein [Acidimicrobiales bacterium]|nr:LOG family protein [Acidimicrobiales bacterium]